MARAKTSHGEEKKSLRSDKDDLKPLDDATTGGGGRNRVIVEDDELFESERSMEDSGESSFSSSELAEDASSSTLDSPPLSSPSSSPNSVSTSGPLYGMSDLMANLPVKRGLSKFYQGKSQSFTSLARVDSIEDLAKKENPYQRRLKMCRSYAGGLDNQKSYSPRATISKRSSSRGSLLSSSSLQKRSRHAFASDYPNDSASIYRSFRWSYPRSREDTLGLIWRVAVVIPPRSVIKENLPIL